MKPNARSILQLYLDDEYVELSVDDHQQTLLDFLRLQHENYSVKEGCAEGDCGACMVLQAQMQDGQLTYQPVNSCIKFLPTCHKKSLYTTAFLSKSQEELHPVQQALVASQGSQCGFCTPGFVISLLAHYLKPPTEGDTEEEIIRAISGNLCRCTGYRPIIEAGKKMSELVTTNFFTRAEAYSEKRIQQQKDLESAGDLIAEKFIAPSALKEFASFYMQHPEYQLLSGGTDIGLWVTQKLVQLKPILYIGEVTELKKVIVQDDGIWIGAAVSLEDAYCELIKEYPELQELHYRFASYPIRKTGTFCGNLANGSPIGDSMPILIALQATLELRQGERIREIALEEFYLDYQKKNLEVGEFVQAVKIPLRKQNSYIATYKISKRYEQDISAVCIGIQVSIEQGVIATIRLAYGGMAGIPKRALHVEAALLGKVWNLSQIHDACASIDKDFQPLSDLRATSEYRLQVAKNLLIRFYHEQRHTALSLKNFSPVAIEDLKDE